MKSAEQLAEELLQKWNYYKPGTSEHADVKIAFIEGYNADKWIRVKDETPIAWRSGDFDGKQSDLVLTYTFATDSYKLGRTYQGVLDGNKFCDWYDERDFEISPPDLWKPLESPLSAPPKQNNQL